MKGHTKKRLGIFVTYDKDGIIDNYVCYLLRSLKPWLADLVIVCNGQIKAAGFQKLHEFTDHIFARENRGYDITAWKTAVFEFIGIKKISEYEEIIFFNDSFYGPIYPWESVFQKMDSLEIDFWGLTKHSEAIECVRGRIPEHIQCYFMAVRRKLFTSDDFASYWNTLDVTNKTFLDAILQHELKFTSHFMNLGYQWQVYVNAPCLESVQPEKNYNHYYLSPLEIVRDCRCPIIKKKALYEKNLSFVLGEEAAEVIQYIQESTEYPVDLIMENLIRLIPHKTLYEAFHMHYILNTNNMAKRRKKRKILLHLSGDLKWKNITNINKLKCNEKFELTETWCNKNHCLTYEKAYGEYDLIGMIKFQDGTDPLVCLHYNEFLWENMVASHEYLEQVLNLFDDNSYLGAVYPFIVSENMDLSEMEIVRKSFWCRPEYVLAPEKYLFGTICSEDYAALTLEACSHVLENMQSQTLLPDIFNKKDVFSSYELERFVYKNKKIFVFGTGIYGRRMFDFLQKKGRRPDAFVVSDGQQHADIFGIRVLPLSKFLDYYDSHSECGLVVALSKKIQQEVKMNIQNSHLKNVFYL